MAAVVLQVTQSGSATTSIHAQPGDTLSFQLNETVESNVLDQMVDDLVALTTVTGVNFTFNNAGGAT